MATAVLTTHPSFYENLIYFTLSATSNQTLVSNWDEKNKLTEKKKLHARRVSHADSAFYLTNVL